MQYPIFLCGFLGLASGLFAQNTALPNGMAPAQDAHIEAEWQEKWNNSLVYTLALLNEVPEEQLHFRPTADQMSIQQQLQHMAGNMFSLSRRYLEQAISADSLLRLESRLKIESTTKGDLVRLLEESYAFAADAVAALDAQQLAESVDFFAGPKTRRQIIWVLQDHATHHRGQLIVYARLLGIAPPRYVAW